MPATSNGRWLRATGRVASHRDPHADTNANPTRHYADVWLCLRRVTACQRVLGWAFTPGADCDATRSLAADIRKGKRAGGVVHGASGVGLMMVMPLPGC